VAHVFFFLNKKIMKAYQTRITEFPLQVIPFLENIFTKIFKLSLPTQNLQLTAAQNFSSGEGRQAGKREKTPKKGRARQKLGKKKKPDARGEQKSPEIERWVGPDLTRTGKDGRPEREREREGKPCVF
jgi:hypothetical protein